MIFDKMQLAIFILIGWITSPVCAASIYFPQCPKEIRVSQTLQGSYPGWRPVNQSFSSSLDGVSFSIDEPEKTIILKPEKNTHDGSIWYFQPQDKVYITCEYTYTAIRLTQRLPKQTIDCGVRFDKNIQSEKGPMPVKIICHRKN